MMDPKAIGKAYDQIADRWNSDAFDRSNGIAQHERAVAFVEGRGTALDVGCGSSGRFIDLLLAKGFSVEGIDISERMIALAKNRHPNLIFHHADICEWELPRNYDFITAWDSIWHAPLASQEPIIRKLLSGLNSKGVCIFSTGGIDAPNEKTDSYMGPEVSYSALGIPRLLEVIGASDCVCRHLEYDQYPQQHLYLIAQKA